MRTMAEATVFEPPGAFEGEVTTALSYLERAFALSPQSVPWRMGVWSGHVGRDGFALVAGVSSACSCRWTELKCRSALLLLGYRHGNPRCGISS